MTNIFPSEQFNSTLATMRKASAQLESSLKSLGAELAQRLSEMFPDREEFDFACIDIEDIKLLGKGEMFECDVLCNGLYTKEGGVPSVEVYLNTDGEPRLTEYTVVLVLSSPILTTDSLWSSWNPMKKTISARSLSAAATG